MTRRALLGGNQPTPLRLCPQVSMAFQDLAVRFSEDEWRLLGEGQRALYLDVMRENYETLASLGTVELLPLSAFLCPSEPGGAVGGGGCAADGQDPPRGGGPLGGAPQHSLHLSALVQLVKEIPEFLFGEVSPESRGASLDGEGASPEAAAVMGDTCPLRGLLGCLPDTPVSRPGLAAMPSGSSSRSPPRARGQGSPLPIKTADMPRPVEEESPGAPSQEPSPPTCSPGRRKSHRNQERRATGAGAAGTSPGNSPLQGLINCLKEILEPGPQHPERPLRFLPPAGSLGASQLTGAELRPGSPPWAVKTETASGACPLQSLLNCLKEIPEARDKQPSPSGARDPWLQEDPGAWKRNSGGPRPFQTPPPGPGPGAGSVLSAVKVEDGWAQGPPEPTACELSKRTHGPSTAGSPGDSGGTARVQVPSWGSAARAGSASSSPLEALEACLRGIPLSGSLPSQPPASSWSQSPQPGDPGSQRPELQRLGSHSRGSQGTSASFSSSSSIDGDLDFQSPEGSQGHRPGKGSREGSSPLQGLENCLREMPAPGPQPTWPCSSAGHRGPRRVESKNWTAGVEGLRGEACEPAHLGQRGGDVPTRSLRLASPQALAPGTIPACHQQGPKDPGAARPGPWRWLPDGPATKPSPLHCLENSLKGILPGGPLHFACLADPVPGPSPSPSSSSSSSEGEDPRLEPELWQPLLQERDRLPSCKGLGPPSPRPGGPRAGSSPGEGRRRGETGDHRGLSAAGKAEEKVGGRSHPPWREVCLESLGPPGPLGSAGGGRVQVSPVRVALGGRCVSTRQVLCALPAGAAVDPASQLETRSGSGPCQPPGSACGPLSWNPTAGEESRGLGPGDGSPGVTGFSSRTSGLFHKSVQTLFRGKTDIETFPRIAGTHPRPLPGDPPGPTPGAAIPGALPHASPRPPCPCASSLQHELRGLGAALSEKLDRLAGTLAGLAQEVAAVRTQVDRLGRRPWGPGTKGLLWGPRWTGGPAHRHPPYWRHKGPRRPRPKILRGQAEGCRAGDSSGLASGRPRLVPQLPPDVPLAEASGPSSGPLSSACGSPAVLTACHPLGLPESHWSPPPPLLPAAPPLQVAASAGAEPRAAAAAPPRTLKWPKDPSSLLAGLQRALEGELWGGEHRDPGWGPPSRRLNGLHPSEDAPPLASSGGRPPPSAPCSRTFPVSGL
ncbi:protein KRBA1 isoform X1 [Sagmatias obliquidens]|uniref:protein KRBA1 isoform X1 n=1 Tax=Sagmatias obliquidens TaxID=3371155 RepID=UPI000F445BDF|nr:protein KRBA1 isoform X1 [Lagenorhynchus obliquidens]